MSNVLIQPCAICNTAPDVYREDDEDFDPGWYAECRGDVCRAMYEGPFDSRKDAVSAWNSLVKSMTDVLIMAGWRKR